MPVPHHPDDEKQSLSDSPTSTLPRNIAGPSPPSASTVALLSLSQDISALISLSLEATASLVHDWFRVSLSTLGLVSNAVVPYRPPNPKPRQRGDSGRGLAVVVVGAGEATGQSLSLQLAKSGYTVFPLLPLPASSSSSSSQTSSAALSSLLLTWSATQKRLRARNPNHPGAIVPIIIDSESASPQWIKDIKAKERFRHASETVRVYLRENRLRLVSIVCAGGSEVPPQPIFKDGTSSSEDNTLGLDMDRVSREDATSVDDGEEGQNYEHREYRMRDPSPARHQQSFHPLLPPVLAVQQHTTTLSPRRPISGLLGTNETTLISLYRSNIVDPLTVIRELRDLLDVQDSYTGSKGRIVFVSPSDHPSPGASDLDGEGESSHMVVLRMVGYARKEAVRLLRAELGVTGVDVCEVVVGPMAPRLAPTPPHLRYGSEDSSEGSTRSRVNEALVHARGDTYTDALIETPPSESSSSRDRILATRLALLSRLWAVDDALLYSSVRRAIEDRYPRYRHHAGLSPLVGSVVDMVPGSGVVKMVGRWVLGRLLTPRGS